MRKVLAVLLLLLLFGGAITFIVYRVLHKSRVKTLIGWHAQVTTVAGDGRLGFNDATQARQASFSDPFGIAIAPDGSVFISDSGDSNRIRKLSPNGTITTFAGGLEGFSDGQSSSARFNSPSGITFDSAQNLYVADTANNRIRKITPEGNVSTFAGTGRAGYVDGWALSAEFDGPIGIAVDGNDTIYIADTYNDRIRKIAPTGEVTTIAGGGQPGYADGPAANALFDTPCGLVVGNDGAVIVADTGNNRLRKITPDGQVTTLSTGTADIRKPVGITVTQDGFLYVSELDRSVVVQIAPDGTTNVIDGGGPGSGMSEVEDGSRFNQPTGIAVDTKGDLYVADSANYLIRKLSHAGVGTDQKQEATVPPLPKLSKEILGEQSLRWPVAPQESAHEVVATMGEVRGSFDSKDARDHLHSGLDVFASYGEVVHAIRSEKTTSPLPNWGFGGLNEGLRAGIISYIHLRVARDIEDKPFHDSRFIFVNDDNHKLTRVRIRRGTRFQPGDALGTVNRMYHVHLNVGPPGAELNPLALDPIGFSDHFAPVIEPDGIQLFNEDGERLNEKRDGRVMVHGRIRIVVNAFDRTDMNTERRRLGLYRLGYQLLKPDGSAATGFEQPVINILFNRLPADSEAVKLAYAEASGITVYGSSVTTFLYEVTNVVRDGHASRSSWDTSALPPGNYTLRIIAADYSGNEAQAGRDLLISVER